jgi:hypothetical protein
MASPVLFSIPPPTSLRLVRRDGRHRSLRVPFGLSSFSDSDVGNAVAVALDVAAGKELDELAQAAAQIPPASTFDDGTLVIVLGDADSDHGLLERLFQGGRKTIPRAVRASALLARGYIRIAAGVDPLSGLDLTWGFAMVSSG